MKKISKKISPRKGGWPARDRTPLVLRPESKLLARVDGLAERAGCSRSRLIEQWLEALTTSVELADSFIHYEGAHPQIDAEALGLQLVRELRSLGVLHQFICQGVDIIDEEHRRMIAQFRASETSKKGRAK